LAGGPPQRSIASAWAARQGGPFGASLRDGFASLDAPPGRCGFAPIRKREEQAALAGLSRLVGCSGDLAAAETRAPAL